MEKCRRYTMAGVNILLGCVSPVLQIIVGKFMVIFLSLSYLTHLLVSSDRLLPFQTIVSLNLLADFKDFPFEVQTKC
jgi:hypothetical protein